MFSRIQDLDRYKTDCIRFELAIAGQENEIQHEGQQLFDQLVTAVKVFDDVTVNLIKKSAGHIDHAQAQEQVQHAKEAMEKWMALYAPNTHVDTIAELAK